MNPAPAYARDDKVICLWDWTAAQLDICIVVPKIGEIYTVRELIPPQPGYDFWSVLLHEVSNPTEEGALHEPSFSAKAFAAIFPVDPANASTILLSAMSSKRRN